MFSECAGVFGWSGVEGEWVWPWGGGGRHHAHLNKTKNNEFTTKQL